MRALMWFRSDLRVRDNTALAAACRAADAGVVAVYAVCREQWKEHDWSAVKVDFILRTLQALRKELASINVPLKILDKPSFGGLEHELFRLAQSCDCDALYFNREYEVNERRRDDAVIEKFEREGLGVKHFVDQTVFEPGHVRTNEGKFYSVFTPYRRKWEEHYKAVGGFDVQRKPAKQKDSSVKPDDVPGKVEGFTSRIDSDVWPAGEDEAGRALGRFIDSRIDDYGSARDDPAADATSHLSHFLVVGAVSPRQCLKAAAGAHGDTVSVDDTGAGSWMNEIIWREFYKHVLVGWPRVSMHKPFRKETERLDWQTNDEHFKAWCEGRTGYPIVDAGMRQLNAIGWMHNRLRMITAMFMTKDLFLDWRLGERYFMQHLIDGDLASNNGGWQWSASTGTDAQPYFRVFNPIRQSERYDPDGDYIRKWIPELEGVDAKTIHDPERLAKTGLYTRGEYPEPIVDRSGTKDRVVKAFKALRK